MNINIPRKEHPKPQFERQDWLNLNGEWQFEIDNGRSGAARGLYQTQCRLTGKILVPFCPESKLSGIQHKDFMYGCRGRREIEGSGRKTRSSVKGKRTVPFQDVSGSWREAWKGTRYR